MNKVQIHNRRLDMWFVVDNGKVYIADVMIQLPNNSRETIGALQYVEKQMNEIYAKMQQIDPILGDATQYHEYKQEWLRLRAALAGTINKTA